jgi:hypothetical protein
MLRFERAFANPPLAEAGIYVCIQRRVREGALEPQHSQEWPQGEQDRQGERRIGDESTSASWRC